MRQPYMIIDGKRYEQGTIFVVKHHNGIGFVELRTTFVYYDTERNRYCFLTPNRYNADCATIYPDIRFMDNLIRVDTPTEREAHILQRYLVKIKPMTGKARYKNDSDHTSMLLTIGLIILFAVLPPVGLVVLLCIVFSDGTLDGFFGCLTPFLILVGIALITMLFS